MLLGLFLAVIAVGQLLLEAGPGEGLLFCSKALHLSVLSHPFLGKKGLFSADTCEALHCVTCKLASEQKLTLCSQLTWSRACAPLPFLQPSVDAFILPLPVRSRPASGMFTLFP